MVCAMTCRPGRGRRGWPRACAWRRPARAGFAGGDQAAGEGAQRGVVPTATVDGIEGGAPSTEPVNRHLEHGAHLAPASPKSCRSRPSAPPRPLAPLHPPARPGPRQILPARPAGALPFAARTDSQHRTSPLSNALRLTTACRPPAAQPARPDRHPLHPNEPRDEPFRARGEPSRRDGVEGRRWRRRPGAVGSLKIGRVTHFCVAYRTVVLAPARWRRDSSFSPSDMAMTQL